MAYFEKIKLAPGLYWLEVKDANLRILCGCPSDSVKFMLKRGLIKQMESHGLAFESGPNAILLSDLSIQKGDLCNLAEFPILQMFYRQGFLIPGHINNTGQKPLLIGTRQQVRDQLEYIYRGNYGLTSLDELTATGLDKGLASEMMKIKIHFAFGQICHPEEFLELCYLDQGVSDLHHGVQVKRLGLNHYEFKYQKESIQVDLNLQPDEEYKSPLAQNPLFLRDQYFSVIHSGEGDGWDVERGSMGSVLNFDGHYYLVDAGPNIDFILQNLGISMASVKGVFQTHGHDDHCAGLTSLFHCHRRLKFFATPWVRASVYKKMCALLGISMEQLSNFFQPHDLEMDDWNRVDGLEVKPSYSPHPIETTIFKFRLLWEGGHRTYFHLADISSYDVMDTMVHKKVIDPSLLGKIKQEYLEPADVKKIDIGGGMIHGNAVDFKYDRSKRVILAHKAEALSKDEKEIGSSAPFGSVDILVPSQSKYPTKRIENFLRQYFPMVPLEEFRSFLQCPVETKVAGSILFRERDAPPFINLIVSGVVERITADHLTSQQLLAGSIIGDAPLVDIAENYTYRAISYVQTSQIPKDIYREFISRLDLKPYLKDLYQKGRILSKTEVFSQIAPSIHYSDTIQELGMLRVKPDVSFDKQISAHGPCLVILESGKIYMPEIGESLSQGDFCCEDWVATGQRQRRLEVVEESRILTIPAHVVQAVPSIYWQVIEKHQWRQRLMDCRKDLQKIA
ncbi:MBL fold metallo-hydrolase [Pseudobacteriovorax antillogorgiicola]|uniref:Hemerythrin n=1 Tax=Pseudobacteriovorax antillogorgiicola TaxID=1513793 RepID=A0A1Y6CK72_9BACT|nr:MBL fold metallo-hydrolase [Pseudobacteriovorax antillogorgiicola]TCS46347.1 hemerythrin [Pseudobacteriovorax antillogorgiicola]SMF68096.1 hemerythrin [Pseudobacteriovorax antillogorgiicola]